MMIFLLDWLQVNNMKERNIISQIVINGVILTVANYASRGNEKNVVNDNHMTCHLLTVVLIVA